MLISLHMSEKSCTFAPQKFTTQKPTIMAQETLKSLIAVIMTLSVQEQKQVITELQENIDKLNQVDITPYTMQEIDAQLDEAERDIEEGRYFTTEEVFHSKFAVAI